MNGRNLPGLFAVLIPGLLFAQQVELSGGITDPQGKAVAGATVYLDRDTREVASVRSDGQGRFRFHDIAPGPTASSGGSGLRCHLTADDAAAGGPKKLICNLKNCPRRSRLW